MTDSTPRCANCGSEASGDMRGDFARLVGCIDRPISRECEAIRSAILAHYTLLRGPREVEAAWTEALLRNAGSED